MIPFFTLVRICLFAAKPQDLPSSRQILVLSIATAMVILFGCYSALPEEKKSLLLTVVHVSATGVCWLLLLKYHQRLERWYQSATAVYGCTSLISLVQLPMVLNFIELYSNDPQQPVGSVAMLVASMWFWEIAVLANIMRQTFEIKMGVAVAFSLGFTFAIQFVLLQVLGSAT